MAEFVTLGKDCTIRLWDVLTAQQKFEFNSPTDEALSACYHPSKHVLACGFKSGCLRVFDVETVSTVIERKKQKAPLTAMVYVHAKEYPLLGRTPLNSMPSTYDQNMSEEAFSNENYDPNTVDLGPHKPAGGGSRSSTSHGYLLLFAAGKTTLGFWL